MNWIHYFSQLSSLYARLSGPTSTLGRDTRETKYNRLRTLTMGVVYRNLFLGEYILEVAGKLSLKGHIFYNVLVLSSSPGFLRKNHTGEGASAGADPRLRRNTLTLKPMNTWNLHHSNKHFIANSIILDPQQSPSCGRCWQLDWIGSLLNHPRRR